MTEGTTNEIRRVALSVLQAQTDGGVTGSGKAIAVTSAISGEGVSYVTRLICAELLRDTKRQTFYCTIDQLAQLPEAFGQDMVRFCDTDRKGLWTMKCSEKIDSDWDFDSDARKRVLHQLRKHFHYIVVDTPAVCRYPDIAAIARLVDAIFLVVGAGMSTKRQILRSEQIIASAGGSISGTILNRSRIHTPGIVRRLFGGEEL